MSWPIVALGEVAEIVSGSTPKSGITDYWGGPHHWATPSDLSKLTKLEIHRTERQITDAGLKSCATRILPPRSVLLSSRAPIGHVAINTVPMATNQGFKSLIPNRKVACERYLGYWLKANTALLQSKGNGATFKELSKRVAEAIEIPLPPLPEQRRIAGILDAADALRRRRRRAIETLATLQGALFAEMFGHAGEWESSNGALALGDAVDTVSGGTPSKQRADYWGGDVPWISPKDMKMDVLGGAAINTTEKAVGDGKAKVINRNTVLIVVRGMILAHTVPVCELSVRASINQDVKGLVPKKGFSASFIAASLRASHSKLLSLTSSSAHGTKRIDMRDLMNLRIPCATVRDQAQFEQAACRSRQMRTAMTTHLAHLDALFSALQSRAFAGAL
jgi:type I restriction enzyme S subunit